MRKNKMLLLLIIGILIFAVFAVIVITIFNSVSNNPIDNLSITYIRNSTDIQNEYGEIITIGKNILYETKNDESTIKTPYTIETETGNVGTIYSSGELIASVTANSKGTLTLIDKINGTNKIDGKYVDGKYS